MNDVLDSARRIFNDNLGDLPDLLAKTMRLQAAMGSKPGMNVNVVAAWCAQHPTEAARIVGAVAMASLAAEGR